MLAAFLEAALRSLILSLVVWAGLRILRVHNVISQRLAWTAVLLGSLLMPFALTFTAQWHLLTLRAIPSSASLEPLRTLLAPATAASSHAITTSLPAVAVRSASIFVSTPSHPRRAGHATASQPRNVAILSSSSTADQRIISNSSALPVNAGRPQVSAAGIALLAYLFVAAVLLLRLLFGIASAMHLWHTSTRIPPVSDVPFGADLNLRSSKKISSPVTIGSGIVLPADYKTWTKEKIRIVLAHERSHVQQHDFHLQILASLYAALAWFSPLGWWLKHKLSDLGEAISDRSGMNAASNRTAYAQVLLEFAAAPRPTLIGVAMARHSSISRRIERLLNDSYLSRAFAGSIRTRSAFLFIPVLLFAGAALVRVQAATRTSQVTPAANAATAASPAVPAAPAEPMSPGNEMSPEAPAVPAAASAMPPAAPLPPSQFALAAPPAPPEPPAAQENGGGAEATFDRNLTVSGKLDLSVATGSGNITLRQGSGSQIHIHGTVKANRDGDPAQVQQIASTPPIEQEGNSIRIGGHQENLRNISVSYEIEAPADAELNAATGSGNITDTGVGHDAKLTTGSGNINATGIEGGFKIQTGSGNIGIEGTGQGDAKAQTGSGNIDLKGVAGALQAQTGSGRIKAEGKPASEWKLQAGSGTIELATGNSPMNLDASTGSGRISTNPPVAMDNPEDHHHLRTQLNGGGPEVRVQTGSGDIHVD